MPSQYLKLDGVSGETLRDGDAPADSFDFVDMPTDGAATANAAEVAVAYAWTVQSAGASDARPGLDLRTRDDANADFGSDLLIVNNGDGSDFL